MCNTGTPVILHNFWCIRIYFETTKILHQQKELEEKILWLLQFAMHRQRSHNVCFYNFSFVMNHDSGS